MGYSQVIDNLIAGRKLEQPIEMNMDQALLLEAVKHLKVIRSSVGILAFFAILGVVMGIISFLL